MVINGWENVDNSPGVVLARIPGVRSFLHRLGILTNQQATAIFPAGIVRADLRKGLSYPAGSIEAVYSSHVIEHLSRWQGLELIRECFRVLAPGGILRIATPDLGELARAYSSGVADSGSTAADTLMTRLMTFHEVPGTRAQQLVRRLVTAPHQWLYDEESLANVFREAGFVNPVRRAFREGDLPDLEQIEHRDDSLIIEGIR